jgi:hypothetical protein
MLATLESMTYLGPARVRSVAAGRVRIAVLDEEPMWATLAIAGTYQPMPDDEVLAIANAGAWYVIGVIRGRGKSVLTVPGDLEITAPRGKIELSAAKGVRIKSAEVSIVADRLEFAARTVLERFVDATRWVQEAFHLRAKRVREHVEEDYDLMAGRILQRAEGDVKIDGHKINLG